jgi:hypothetical protein
LDKVANLVEKKAGHVDRKLVASFVGACDKLADSMDALSKQAGFDSSVYADPNNSENLNRFYRSQLQHFRTEVDWVQSSVDKVLRVQSITDSKEFSELLNGLMPAIENMEFYAKRISRHRGKLASDFDASSIGEEVGGPLEQDSDESWMRGEFTQEEFTGVQSVTASRKKRANPDGLPPVRVSGLPPAIEVGVGYKSPSQTTYVVFKDGVAVGTVRKTKNSKHTQYALNAQPYPHSNTSLMKNFVAWDPQGGGYPEEKGGLKEAVLWVAKVGRPQG